jgi:hypothetical protein
LGAGQPDRTVSDADVRLGQHPAEDGLRYLNWQPSTDPNHLSPEDLAVTILINSHAGPAAFRSAQNHGHVLDIGKLPDVPLEETSAGERAQVASFIAAVTDGRDLQPQWQPRFSTRPPKLIPILDNESQMARKAGINRQRLREGTYRETTPLRSHAFRKPLTL